MQVLLCYKTPEAWPLRIEGSKSDPLPKFFASALKARENDITVKVRFPAQFIVRILIAFSHCFLFLGAIEFWCSDELTSVTHFFSLVFYRRC